MKDTAIDYHQRFQSMHPEAILAFVLREHPGKVLFSSSMGAEDQVITHMLVERCKNPPVFTLDTGRLFQETYDLIEKTNKRFDMNIRVVFPDHKVVEEMVNAKGINLFYHSVENRKRCCHVRKIEPLHRMLKGNDVWITGLRREQSPTRKGVGFAEWDEQNKILKVNPILNWSEEQVWDYIQAHDVPYNVLHDKGYPSIGCLPCTRAVGPDEDIRAGRWWWEQPETRECGLHQARKQ